MRWMREDGNQKSSWLSQSPALQSKDVPPKMPAPCASARAACKGETGVRRERRYFI